MKMNKLFAILLLSLLPCMLFANGLIMTVENDFLVSSDDAYTHGTDIFYIEDSFEEDLIRSTWGLRHRMYSPTHIRISEPQPLDRPWCGVTTIVRQRWHKEGGEFVLYEFEGGVLGPSAQGEFFQTGVHRLINNPLPEGWDNQFPDEPVLNFYLERHHPYLEVGKDRYCFDAGLIYGGSVGTTFDNVIIGVEHKVGWNTPRRHREDIIGSKNVVKKLDPFFYVFADDRAQFVIHNATLGDSFFRDREGEKELEPIIFEGRLGFSCGIKWIVLTCAMIDRSDEFIGQKNDTGYGFVSLEFTRGF